MEKDENFQSDLQAEEMHFTIEIDKVGLEDVKKRIEIHRPDGSYSINLNINAFINLPSHQRGAHMSRSAESIDESITEHLFSPKKNVEEFGVEISRTLLDKHPYCTKSIVEMEGPLIVQMRQREERESAQSSYYLKCQIIGHRKEQSVAENKYGYDIFLSDRKSVV